MGQGVHVECKGVKSNTTQAQPMKRLSSTSEQQNRVTRDPCYLLIPGLLAQTYNMKDVKHQATIPYI